MYPLVRSLLERTKHSKSGPNNFTVSILSNSGIFELTGDTATTHSITTPNATSGAFQYTGTGAATIYNFGNPSYWGLKVTGTGTFALAAATVVAQNLAQSAGIVNLNAFALTVSGGASLGATIQNSGAAANFSVALAVTLTAAASIASANGNVSFSTTLDALAAGTQGLTINAGTGNVLFTGIVGGTTPLGALAVTGGTGTTAYIKPTANITASSASFTGPVQLQGTLTINTSSANGNVSFSTTLDALAAGTQGLTINAGTGNVLFTGIVGGTTPLGALAVTGGTGTTASIKPTANITASSASFTGPVQLQGTLTINTSSANGNVSFSTTLDALAAGTQGLTINAGTGNVLFTGIVGGTTPLGALAVTGGTGTTASIKPTANITASSASFTGPVQLQGTLTINTSSANGNVSFSTTLDALAAGTQGLTINAGTGNVLFTGIVGGTTPLGALAVTGGTGTTAYIKPTANITASSASFTGPVQLQGTLTINTSSANGNVSFSTTLDALAAGTQGLTINAGTGNVLFTGIVGGTTPLGALAVTGGTGTTAYIKPTANITASSASFTGPVQLQGTLTINTSSANGNVSFSTTLDALAAGTQGLTINAGTGNVLFTGIVGGTTPLGALAVTGGTGTTAYIKPTANITASSASFTGPVQLQGTLTINTSSANGNVSFSTTLDALAAGTQGLTINAGTGNVLFTGIVGGTTPLGALAVTGGTGTTAYIKPTANITASSASFTGPVQLQGTLTINTSSANGNVSFSTTLDALAAGTQGLTINAGTGNVLFTGIVGGTTPLGALAVTGGTGTTASIKPTANITASSASFTGPVQLQGTLTINTSSANGNVSFSTTLDALAAGTQGLTINAGTGNVLFTGIVGGTTPLGALAVTGGTGTTAYIKPTANITASSASFTGPVQLQGTLTINTSSANGNVSFSTTLDALAAGTQGLTINAGTGNVLFTGIVGGTTPLGALAVTGGTGTTAYIKPTANITASSASFTGPVQLQGTLTINTSSANGNVSFSTTLDALAAGTQGLTINAGTGNVLFTGIVGGTTPLGALAVTGGMGTTAYIKPTANITASSASFTGPVQLQGTLTINTSSANGNVSFSTTLDALAAGTQGLTINAGTGNVLLSGMVGGTTPLTSVTVSASTTTSARAVTTTAAQSYTAATSTTLNGNLSSTVGGTISFTGPVSLATGSITVQSAGGAADTVSFGSTLDGPQGLTVNAGASTATFTGVVGEQRRWPS